MKLGAIWTWDTDLELFRTRCRQSDELGFDLTGIGDAPPSYQDPYVSLALIAGDIKRGLIGPMVTSPALRNPVANVTAMSALHDLTDGRAILGVGAGNSIAYGLGQKQPRQEWIADYIKCMRKLFDGQEAEWDGGIIKPMRHAKPVKIYYSALGPKAMRAAGQAADGVILQIGESIDDIRKSVAAVRAAARDAGRDPSSIEFWAYSIVSIADSRAQALSNISPYLACNAPVLAFSQDAMAKIPDHQKDAVLEMQRRYDFTSHVSALGTNGKLAEELGLLELLASIKTIAGTIDSVKTYLRQVEAEGISLLSCSLNGQSDVPAAMHNLLAARP